MSKKIYISRDQKKELEGFEDVIDLVADPKSLQDETPLEKKMREEDSYELFGFLENENKRLELIDQFLSEKIVHRTRYSQTRQLLEEQSALQERILVQLIAQFSDPRSILHKNLELVFDKAFIKRE